ncbi:MAG TPA: ATP-binding protein [Bacteroidaceae bacterium]|nr:ATP-binding protein [Bacteroidaceae bacterium]
MIIFQQGWERMHTNRVFEEFFGIYENSIKQNSKSNFQAANLRITLIDNRGQVIFDNNIDEKIEMENHFERPEIIEANKQGAASIIRFSKSLKSNLIYYAIKTDDGYVRVAFPYDYKSRLVFRSNKTLLLLSLCLFLVVMFFLWKIASLFEKDLEKLKADVAKQEQDKATTKSEMTSSISQELRNPVNAIRAYTETLLDTNLTDSKRQLFVERAHDSAVKLSGLLQDLTLLTKIEEAGKQFKKEQVNISVLVEKIIAGFEECILKSSIKVNVDIPKDLTIGGSHTLLYSIFRNLIENSIRYAGKNILLNINYLGLENGFCKFEVFDTGQGVKEADIPHLFERFYRSRNSEIGHEDCGSGLELAIVRHSVLYHGGSIKAENIFTGGLKIVFTIFQKS